MAQSLPLGDAAVCQVYYALAGKSGELTKRPAAADRQRRARSVAAAHRELGRGS